MDGRAENVPHAVRPGDLAVVGRRTVLAGALGLAGTALVGASEAEADIRVGERVLGTYLSAGGEAVLGAAVDGEVRLRISSRNTYGQRFERGTVWWGSGAGLVDSPGTRVRLEVAPNFRPVSGVRAVWRSDDLDGCTPLEKRVVVDLGVETMIALNSGGDPSIPGVDRRRHPISNDGDHLEFYRGYVTRGGSRESVGRALQDVARSDAPVIVHCRGGKDRTGWVCDVLQAVAGVSRDVRDLDYLATQSYSGADVELDWLAAAREQLAADHGTVADYLVEGCALDPDDLALLRTRLR